MSALLQLAEQRFGRLTVLALSHTRPKHGAYWHCLCDCGNMVVVGARELRSGDTTSCGCRKAELLLVQGGANTKHGAASGGRPTAEYTAWQSMKARCSNPNNIGWKHYGGRGIRVCRRWRRFESFLADMGPKPTPEHSLDRINNDKGYSPSNCRWATRTEQRSNQRKRGPSEKRRRMEIESLGFHYLLATKEQKAALASIILHRAADYDLDRLPPDTAMFVSQLKREREMGR